MDAPETTYARTQDGIHLAYQVFGSGPPTVLIPPIVSHVEVVWEHEYNRRVLEHEAQHLRFLQFDKRGIGASDRWDEPPTLEQRIADITAVMDAEGFEKANLIGLSEGGLMAQLFAIAFPERVDRLLLVNTLATIDPVALDPYGGGLDLLRLFEGFQQLIATWGTDPAYMVDWMMPSRAGDEEFVRFTGRYQRLAASPDAFRRQVDSVLALRPPSEQSKITAPTMVMHCADDRVIPVSGGRHLAAQIPGATFVELDWPDHFVWINEGWRDMVDVGVPFLCGDVLGPTVVERRFGALLFSDVVGSTERAAASGDDRWRDALASHDRVTADVVAKGHGRLVKRMGDGLLAIFPTASGAVDAALRLRAEVASIGLTLRVGVHAGEVEVLDDGDLRGLAVHLASRVQSAAQPGEVLVTSTVRELMLGGGVRLLDRGRHALKGIEGDWQLYAVGS
jgi:class 3 adenylate cyclase/pimeloyl-ACP methyl ester carboxylesterase